MSRQKSITSFFTKVVTKAVDVVGENGIKDHSPLKSRGTSDVSLVDDISKSPKQTELPTKKRRWNRLQSDSEASDGEDNGASSIQGASANTTPSNATSPNATSPSSTHLQTSNAKVTMDIVETNSSPRLKCRKIGDLRGGFGAKTLDPGILSNKNIIFPSTVSGTCAFNTSGKDTINGGLGAKASDTESEKEPKLSSEKNGHAKAADNVTNSGDIPLKTTTNVTLSPTKLKPEDGHLVETGKESGTKTSDDSGDMLISNPLDSDMKLKPNTPVKCNGTEAGGIGTKSPESKTEDSIPISVESELKIEPNCVDTSVMCNGTESTGDSSKSPIINTDKSTAVISDLKVEVNSVRTTVDGKYDSIGSPTSKSENEPVTKKPKHEVKIEQKSDAKKEVHSFFAPRKSTVNPKKDKKSSPPKKSTAEQKSLPSKKADAEKDSGAVDREANFDPSKKNYHPINDAFWDRGDNVPYLALAKTLEQIEAVSARLKIIEILSNYLRSVIVLSPDDLLPSIYLCLNKLAPAYEGVELGIAETTLMKAIAQSTGRSVAQIKSDSTATGDLGIVAEQSRSNQRMMFQPAKLTVKSVFERIKDIALMTGHASMSKKVDKIQSMFVACRQSEARYLIRSLAGKLRIGLAEQSVLQALALACATTPPEQAYPHALLNASKEMSAEAFKARVDECSLIVKTTYCECPNYNMIVPVLLKEGVDALPKHCRLSPGIPLKPMLAHPTKGVHEVLQRFDGQTFTCEWKYDGERAQIHLHEDKSVSIYSRNQENNTSKYPDVTGRLSKALGPNVTSCILDCEAVAWDKEKKQILPFQILSTRKRKDANESEIKVAVCVFMFDLLYLNGRALVKETLLERRQLLRDNFLETEGEFIFATNLDTSTMDEVQNFLEDAVKGNCEGLMVKTLESDATYEIAKRSRNWLKLKKDYLEGVGDTIDVVVIGGYLGRGKRTGAYGGFLLACYDPDNEEYQSLCKIGTGFSDESLQQHSEFFKDKIINAPRSYYRYDSSHEPDHWFDAVQVWEIKCADLSLSPVHRAALGIVDPEKGISLRFPRFLRVRDDKNVEDATSASEVAELYNKQDQVKNQQGSSKVIEEDFY